MLRDEIIGKLQTAKFINASAEHVADQILSLVEMQRCEWTYDAEREWVTSCGEEVLDDDTYGKYPFCPCCGKKILIKEEHK